MDSHSICFGALDVLDILGFLEILELLELLDSLGFMDFLGSGFISAWLQSLRS